MQSTPKLELNYHDRLYSVQSMMKTRQDNDMTGHTGMISIEYNIELPRWIRQCVVYDEDET